MSPETVAWLLMFAGMVMSLVGMAINFFMSF